MIFNSAGFLLFFFPVAMLLFLSPRLRRFRLPILLILSLFLYETSAGGSQLLLLVLCVGWVHFWSGVASAVSSRGRLAMSIIVPAAVLIYFKYAAFLLSTVGLTDRLPSFSGGLPAGISFYVFHMISFAIDRYRGDLPQAPSRVQFATYVAFFPQLVAGPITRFRQVGDSIRRITEFRHDAGSIWAGVSMLSVGLASKLLLADPLAGMLAPLLKIAPTLDRASAAFVFLAYSFRIYFDFYGYSMMAMGLGALFGIVLPKNFDRPYLSLNPREFWRRWHMTLSFWIRDYLYLPLGGNRHYVRNILIVFGACGLWHGAGWNFVVWGLYHGGLILIYSATRRGWDRLPGWGSVVLTFLLVTLGWPLFALDLPSFMAMATNLFHGGGEGAQVPLSGWLLVIASAGVAFGVDTDKVTDPAILHQPWFRVRQAVLAVLTAAAITLVEGSQPFIYFQF